MMLESMQQKMQGPMMKVFLFIIIIFFVFAGYFSATLFSNDPEQIAEIDGVKVTNSQVNAQIANRRANDSNFDAKYPTEASLEALKFQIREQLISERVFLSNINKAGFTASDAQIENWIQNFPSFQINGEYSAEQARSILQTNGWTEQRLKAYAVEQITREQMTAGLLQSGFTLDNEVETFYRLNDQTRDVRVLRIPQASFAQDITISDEAIQEYYQQNPSEFEQAEQVNVDYVRLSADELAKKFAIDVTDEEIAAFYNTNAADYRAAQEIKIAHILIDNSVDNAEEKATALLERLNAGEDFATLAKENSSDTLSAENNGELDWADAEVGTTGWDEAFEAAALALTEAGQLSQVVESQFGFHILKLADLRGGEVSALADVSEQIKAEIAAEKADKVFFEKQVAMKDAVFSTGSVSEFAQIIDLPVLQSGIFSRANANDIFANPAFIEKAFSADLIASKEISDMLEIGDKDIVFLAINEYLPSSVKALELVKEQINANLKDQKASADTLAFAESIKTALEAKEDSTALLESKALVWVENPALKQTDPALEQEIVNAVYRQTAPQGDALINLEKLSNGDSLLIELKAVNYPEVGSIDEAKSALYKQRLQAVSSQGDMQNLIEEFKLNTEVK